MSATTNRRNVLKTLAAGSAVSLLPMTASAAKRPAWVEQVDVVVVGSGAAGSAAAIAAAGKGASVLILEKMPFAGGTTAKSDGIFWIPNNPLLRAKGIVDARADALRYMVRLSYPTRYDAQGPTLGVSALEFGMIAAFYDNASRVIEALVAAKALKIASWKDWNGEDFTDYHSLLPENRVPQGRSLLPAVDDPPFPGGGNGSELLRQLQGPFASLRIQTRLEHRVRALVRDARGAVIGVEVERGEGDVVRIGARRGVVFCSGGFTANADLCNRFLRGHVWAGGAAPGSTGDFVDMATAAGATLGNMTNAWWGQVPIESALASRSLPAPVWVIPGDSAIQVNRRGQRFANEKGLYNERTQAHFYWDAAHDEYPNHLGFMIWDQRNATQFAGIPPIPPPGTKSELVIEGATLEALTSAIAARLQTLSSKTGGVHLDDAFLSNLKATAARYNGFARNGVDEDFARGQTPAQLGFHLYGRKKEPGPYPNPTMFPLADSGPYYAVILGAGTLDTKGGPVIDAAGRVLDAAGQPIAGLFGAGNCIAGPAGQAYWAGGGTLGPALTFGYLAGENAAAAHHG